MKFLAIAFLATMIGTTSFAQEKTEKIKVAGECGMCKKKIETSAKKAGASFASWNSETKVLEVKYEAKGDQKAKIEKAVAAAGYDTETVKATEEAYQALHECCKYERTATAPSDCCKDGKCTMDSCSHGDKCTADKSCCKDSGCDKKDCCKKQ